MIPRRVYLDTCVLGELVSKPSSSKRKTVETIIKLACEGQIKVFTSKYVKDEIEESPENIRNTLLRLLGELPHKEVVENEEILYLAKRYSKEIGLTRLDAFHVAVAVINALDVFLSFNRRTIINKKVSKKLKKFNESMGYKTPLLLTPDEFSEKVNKEKTHIRRER